MSARSERNRPRPQAAESNRYIHRPGKISVCKKGISPIFVTNAAFIPATAIPSPHYCADQPAADFPDLGELRVGGMRACVFDEPRKVGMGDQHAERVEDYRCPILSGSLRVDQIAELIELEVGGDDAVDMPTQRRTKCDHRRADAKRGIG